MLFGGSGKSEEVNPDKLEDLLNLLLDKKLSKFDSKASGILKDLGRAKLNFEASCQEFDKETGEPNKLNMYIDNISFVKTQKGFYSKSLKHVIDSWDISGSDSKNVYIKYSTIAKNTDKFTNEILKTNASFKKMLYSYSDYLDSFKKSFSYIERLRDALRSELDKADREFAEYNVVSEQILNFNLVSSDLDNISKSITGLNEYTKTGSTSGINEEELEISKDISKRREEAAIINTEATSLANRVSSFTMPLERAARKQDHISPKKKQLYTFMADPVRNIRDETDYNDFKALLADLDKSVDAGLIDIKNNSRTKEMISDLLNKDIYDEILSFRSLEKKKSDLEEAIRHLEIMLNKIKEDKNQSAKTFEDIASMKKESEDLRSKIGSTKSRIEALFLEYYNKKISIINF